MSTNLKIKVCGMKFSKNMTQVANLRVDFLGFIFYPNSPRYMADSLLVSDLQKLPNSIKKVGVFVNESIETILQQARHFKLDAIQLHGSESPEICDAIQKEKLLVFKAFSIDSNFDPDSIKPYEDVIDYVLLDTKTKAHGGSGKKFDWSILETIKTHKPLILSGGIGPEDVIEIQKLSHLNIHALDLNSKFEDEPGLKNIDKLAQFLSRIQATNSNMGDN